MKALVFDRAGDPLQVLQHRDVADPTPGSGHVLVRVDARPIHPADLAFVRGQYRAQPQFPQVAGLEGAGVIVDSGVETGWAAGTRVAFRAPGAWADLIAAPVDRLIRVPEGMDSAPACQVSLNPLTAFGLLQEASVGSGDAVIVTAATSTVANLVGAIARARGIRTIGLVRGDPVAAAERCLADAVLSIDAPDPAAAVLDAAGGKRPAAILDSVGGPLIPRLSQALRPGATIVAYGVQSNEPAAVTNALLIYSNLTWKGFGIDRWLSQNGSEVARLVEAELWPMIRNGQLQLPVEGSYPLEDFERALKDAGRSGRRGKVLLR